MKKVIHFILLILTLMLTGVFGAAAASSYPFKVANIAYTNSEFALAEQMKAGDTVYLAATIEKCASSDVKPVVVTAVFDQDNKLYQSYINLFSGMTAGQQLTTLNGISLPVNFERLSVKVMMFRSLATIMPVALPLEKQLSNAANTNPVPTQPDNPPAPEENTQYRIRGMVEATGISDTSVRAGESKIRIDAAAFVSNGTVQWVTPDAAKMPFLSEANAAFYTDCVTGDYSDMEYYLDKNIEAVLSYNDKSFRYTLKKIEALSVNREVSFRSEDIYDGGTGEGNIAVYSDRANKQYDNYKINIKKLYINGRELTIERIPGTHIYENTAIDQYNIQEIIQAYANSNVSADIRLLDNSESGSYSIAYITSYVDYVVNSIDVENKCILVNESPQTGMGGQARPRLIIEEKEGQRFNLYKEGGKISFQDIRKGDMLCVAGFITSNSKIEYGNITVKGPELHGKVTGMDLEEKTIWINNVPYPVNSDVLLKMEGRYLGLGDSARFYNNNRGIIVHYLIDKTLEYGFATQAAKTGTFVEQYQIKLLDSAGQWRVLPFADKVRFNGERVLTSITSEQVLREKIGSIYNGSAEMQGSNIVINKVIGYEVNSKNEIDKFYGIPSKLNYESEFGHGWETAEVYDAAQGLYAGKYITDQTVLFSTSKQPTSKIPLEQSEVFVNRKEALTDKKAYDLLLYNIDTNDRIFAISGVGLFEENLEKESTLSQVRYGFATAVGKNGGMAPNYQIHILNSDGRWANLSFAQQVFFNGEDIAVNSGKENFWEVLADKIGNLNNSGPAVENANGIYPVNKVFSYQTNQDGLVAKLCFRPGNELNVREISGVYRTDTGALGDVFIGEDTPIFSTAAAVTDTEVVEESQVSVGRRTALTEGTSYQMTAYEINAENKAGALYGVGIEGLTMEFRQSQHYGFATGLWETDEFDTAYSLQLLGTDGEWKTYDFAKYVEINGENAVRLSACTPQELAEKIGGVMGEGPAGILEKAFIVNRVVAFDTDINNEITGIYFKAAAGTETEGFTKKVIQGVYDSETRKIGDMAVREETFVFSTLEEPTDSALLRSNQVVLGNGGDLLKRTNYTGLYAYHMNPDSIPAIVSGTGVFDVIEKNSEFFTVSHTSLKLDEKTNKPGVLLSGISGGQEVEIFAPEDECKVYKIDFGNGEFIEPPNENLSLTQISPCDILLYNQSIHGRTTRLYVLKNVEEIIKIDSMDLQDSFLPNSLLKVAAFQADGKEYAYYLGYVLGNTGNTIQITNDTAPYERLTLYCRNKNASIIDYWASGKKILAGKTNDAAYGPLETDKCGDMVFVCVTDNVVVTDTVVFRNQCNSSF